MSCLIDDKTLIDDLSPGPTVKTDQSSDLNKLINKAIQSLAPSAEDEGEVGS